MQKLITLRFQAICKRCGETLPAGSRAIWLGSKQGVQHQTCKPKNQEIEKPKEQTDVDRMTFDYAQLRTDFSLIQRDPGKVYTRNVAAYRRDLERAWSDRHFAGCTIQEMQNWIDNGYHVAGLEGISSLIPGKPRRKIRYSDEGDELLVDLAWSGSDEPFMEWEKRVSKPGLSVEIHSTFDSMFPASTIAAFQRWIARALQTLDENGVDMEVSIVERISYPMIPLETETLVRVRRAGEASDFSNWSAMFSPGGYRMLGILASGKHCDALGKTIPQGHGESRTYGAWTVAYDESTNRIVIGSNDGDYVFPELEMTEKLTTILQRLNG